MKCRCTKIHKTVEIESFQLNWVRKYILYTEIFHLANWKMFSTSRPKIKSESISHLPTMIEVMSHLKIQTIIISQFHQLIVKHGWSEEFGTDKLSSSEWLDREGIESCEQGSWGIFSYTSDRYSVMFVYPTLHYTLIELG